MNYTTNYARVESATEFGYNTLMIRTRGKIDTENDLVVPATHSEEPGEVSVYLWKDDKCSVPHQRLCRISGLKECERVLAVIVDEKTVRVDVVE